MRGLGLRSGVLDGVGDRGGGVVDGVGYPVAQGAVVVGGDLADVAGAVGAP